MKDLPPAYDPAAYEDAVYRRWEQSGAFRPASDRDPKAKRRKPYTIIMPPPNATGVLHLGHALERGLQDALVRYHRMKGFDTLYLPGVDHAAIATASVVDRQLLAEKVDKQQLGRAKFATRAKKYALHNKHVIEDQNKALGASADWTRNAFTMDRPREQAVVTAFHRLYRKGLIYRDDYMVNWCPHCRTVLADDEVVHREQEGVLYYMKYGPFELATTRPETKVGDTAVAVHPGDRRYKKYVGQTIEVKTINGPRQLRVIADQMVDPKFGTGVVKITPFHDRNDYEVYRRRPQEAGPPLEVIGEDGQMTVAAGPKLAGLDRFKARTKMVRWLKQEKLLLKEKLHTNSVGRCYRCDTVIEPRISRQWFLKVSELKAEALNFVDRGELKFVPARFEKTYRDWINKLHDWCISRQVWFGHPVPVYLKGDQVSLTKKPGFKPSPDTLDTWFSSALWPFTTMGWPRRSKDLQRFFPGDVLECGYDIIFFWIARMILMTVALDVRPPTQGRASGSQGQGPVLQPPFHTAFLHGLLRDHRGRKFSKSLGNTLDPLELIGKYGADALRFTLTTINTPGTDARLDEQRIAASRNFANKLWNISRFILAQGQASQDDDRPPSPDKDDPLADLRGETLTTIDRAILHKLYLVAGQVESAFHDPAAYDKPGRGPTPPAEAKGFKPYSLGAAGLALQQFVWSDFADWYVEVAKVQLRHPDQRRNTLVILNLILETILKLLHPFMPFITETLWQDGLGRQAPLITTPWPELHADLHQPEDAERFEQLRAAIETIRRLRAEHGVAPATFIQCLLITEEPGWLLENADVINRLARLKMLRVRVDPPTAAERQSSVIAAAGPLQIVLPKSSLIDEATATIRLQGDREAAKMEIARLRSRLANKAYAAKAPPRIVAETKAQLKAAEARLKKLER